MTSVTQFTEQSRSYSDMRGDHENVDTTTLNQNESEEHKTPSFVTYCFTVNYILGVGVLGIPWAFNEAGYILSPIVLGLVSLISYITANYFLETLARAEGHLQAKLLENPHMLKDDESSEGKSESGNKEKKFSFKGDNTPLVKRISVNTHENESIQAPEVLSNSYLDEPKYSENEDVSLLAEERQRNGIVPKNEIAENLFEIPQLCAIYLPPKFGKLYTFLIMSYFLLTLWSYASVFSSSMASHVPMYGIHSSNTCDLEDHPTNAGCIALYTFWLGLFSLIVVPLSCKDLTEQIVVQVTLSIFRFVAVGLMLATTLQALYTYKREDLDYDTDSPPYYSDAVAFDMTGFGKLLPIAVFSQVVHHSIPGISKPQRDKSKLQHIFAGVMTTTCFCYSILGVVLVLWYGSDIKDTCTLNWTSYDAGYDPKPWWVKMLAGIIVLFPPVDLISAYPLNAITLGNNLFEVFVPKEKQTKKKKLMFRLTAAIIPLIGACIIRDLSTILRFSGSIGILIAFTYPCLLNLASKKELIEQYGPNAHVTPYSQFWFSDDKVVWFFLFLSGVLFLLIIIFSFIY